MALYILRGLLIAFTAITAVLKRTGGYAPGFQLRCEGCGHSGDASKAGLIRIGAKGRSKTLGHRSECGQIRWLVVEEKP